MKFLLLLSALLGLSTARSINRLSVDYTLDNQYYEQGRVHKANCQVDFSDSVERYNVCFMQGYTTLGCYERRPFDKCRGSGCAGLVDTNWQYSPEYRSSDLTVTENHCGSYPNTGPINFEVSIKGLKKHERTHCQVEVLPSVRSADPVLYTSNPAHLASNPIPFRETTSCNNDTTTVKIAADSSTSTYTCTVAFSDANQYRQADFSLTRRGGYNCEDHGYYHGSSYRQTQRLSLNHVGGNVYVAKFSAPHSDHQHECHVRLNDGRSYASGRL